MEYLFCYYENESFNLFCELCKSGGAREDGNVMIGVKTDCSILRIARLRFQTDT